MEYLFIYLLQIANCLDGATLFLVIMTISCLVIGTGVYFAIQSECTSDRVDEEMRKVFKPIRNTGIISLTLLILFALIPTRDTLLLMGGTYLGKKAVNAVVTDEKVKKINTIIELELDKRIKELQTTEAKQGVNTNE